MTVRHARQITTTRIHTGQLLFGLGTLFCLLFILRNAEIAMEGMQRGLVICVQSIIPALFPFMVLSEIAVSTSVGKALLSRLSSPLCRLLRLSPAGAVAVLLGLLCGFPVGTKCALLAYDRGEMTRLECERVLALSCTPSSAFLISAVGQGLWNDTRFGVFLYLTVLFSALLCGVLLSRLQKEKIPTPTVSFAVSQTRIPISKLFTGAIRSSAQSIFLICAYVLFFSALTGMLETILAPLALPHTWDAALSMLLELSGGMNAASEKRSLFSAILCAAGGAWSGLSVHCQLLSLCDGRPLLYRTFFFTKLLQAILAAALFALLIVWVPMFP